MSRDAGSGDHGADEDAVDLAHTASFRVGGLEILPSTREVVTSEGVHRLEPRPMQALVALAEAEGRVVSRDDLLRRCWDNRVVGEDAITRVIGVLRALGRKTGAFRLETIARVGYRLIPLTDPDAVVPAEDGDAALEAPNASVRGAAPPSPLRRWGLAAVVLMFVAALAVGLFAWRSSTINREPRIALAAFEPLPSDAQTTAFAKRLTDEVAGVLNENVAGLAPPGPERSLKRADLRVGGSVRREGETLRVRAYLEDDRAKVTLWSRQYERPASEEEALRTEVAVDLSDNLLTAMEPLQQKGLKIDPRAMALWVSASAVHRQGRVVGDPRVAARAFEQVVERAPKFARARGMMAQSLALASATASPAEAPALRRRARAEALEAIRSDPTTADAGYDALYWLARRAAPTDFAKAEDVWASGLARAQNSPAGLMRRCELLLDLGRAKAALPDCQRAAALRPLGAPWGYRYARALAATGQNENAERAIEREVRLHPQHWWIRQVRFRMKAFNGPPAEASALLHDRTQPPAFTDDETQAFEAFLQARASGASADIERAATKLRQSAERGGISRVDLFKSLVTLRRLDEAFALAAPGPEDIGSSQGWLFEPGMEAVQRDPRFWPLAARIGLIAYWRKRGVWPDFCSEPGLPFDCASAAARAGAG
jgi:DNA-binding winged helix-turn-helix (wHTH) protein/TolB-like protein